MLEDYGERRPGARIRSGCEPRNRWHPRGTSGNLNALWELNIASENCRFTVDLYTVSIQNGDFPGGYVSLPEGDRYSELEQLEITRSSPWMLVFHGSKCRAAFRKFQLDMPCTLCLVI